MADEEGDSDVDLGADEESGQIPPPSRKPAPAEVPGGAKRAPAAGPSAAKTRRAGEPASQRKSSSAGTRPADAPGERHKWLDSLVGHWDFRLKLWPEPGGAPSTSVGAAEAKWTMGQRFLQIRSQAKLAGAALQSLWMLGYDNSKRAYTSLYLDDQSTGFFLAEGQAAADGETLQLFGAMHDWMASEHNRAYLYVIRQVDHQHWTLEVQDVLRAEPILQIAYSRTT
jgi:hypothetical protein